MAAKTRGDLAGLFDDLPDTGAPRRARRAGRARRRRPHRTGAAAAARRDRPPAAAARVVVFICANVAWHAFTSLFFFQPLVWAFVVVAAIIICCHRRSHRHDR